MMNFRQRGSTGHLRHEYMGFKFVCQGGIPWARGISTKDYRMTRKSLLGNREMGFTQRN